MRYAVDSIVSDIALLENIETAQFVQKACNVPNRFRLYTNSDGLI